MATLSALETVSALGLTAAGIVLGAYFSSIVAQRFMGVRLRNLPDENLQAQILGVMLTLVIVSATLHVAGTFWVKAVV
jgi:hypothetical protein